MRATGLGPIGAAPGRREGARRARDVRRHRPALRPRQPDHDVPPRRALAAPRRRDARRCPPAAACSTSPAAPATCASTSPAPGYRPIVGRPQLRDAARPTAAARRGCRPTSSACRSPDGVGRRRDVRVRPAQPRRPAAVLRRAGPGRAPGRAHRPARRRHPAQPARALGPRHLLRQGRAAASAAAVGPGGLPLPAAQRRLPAAARARCVADAAARRVRRRRPPPSCTRRHHPAAHAAPAADAMRVTTASPTTPTPTLDLNDIARGDGFLFVRDGVGLAGRGVAARVPLDDAPAALAAIDHDDTTAARRRRRSAIGWVPFEPGEPRRARRSRRVAVRKSADGRRAG